MKSFKELFVEMKEERTIEEINADAHIYNLVNMDQTWRSQNQNAKTFPLEANGVALWAIRNYYLGVKHPTQYPQHASKIQDYKNQWMQEVPHLSAFVHPH